LGYFFEEGGVFDGLRYFLAVFCKLSMSGTHSGYKGERDNERGAKQEMG
jgi:hypothetical protein